MEYAMELMVQIGHLGDILLRQDYKMNRNATEANRIIIGDEIVDVILNTFSIADEQGFMLPSNLSTTDEDTTWVEVIEGSLITYPDPVDPIALYSTLAMTGAIVLQSIVNNTADENVSESLLSITQLSARLAGLYGIDIDAAFTFMQNESELFVKKHSDAR